VNYIQRKQTASLYNQSLKASWQDIGFLKNVNE